MPHEPFQVNIVLLEGDVASFQLCFINCALSVVSCKSPVFEATSSRIHAGISHWELPSGNFSPSRRYTPAVNDAQIQELCERGQRELIETNYMQAVDTFTLAEAAAWELSAFDSLSRLYLPLQEARRQVRQRCAEGALRLRIRSQPDQPTIDADRLLQEIPHGQLLVAGWGSIEPASRVRQIAHRDHLYVETFLAAAFPAVDGATIIALIPLADHPLPTTDPRTPDDLRSALPPHSLVLREEELIADAARGTTQTYAAVMALWERLHRPFLQSADRETDPIRKMEGYRTTLRVDPACELAHQKLAEAARMLARKIWVHPPLA
jgi:hypothetical protein